jgi:hypothetical protein
VRWREKVLRVVTGPVALRGVDLGPFALEFHWGRDRADRPARRFAVVALDPNPAAGREGVVHPHVEGEALCAGEAAEPLGRALTDGRLADAFLLVRSVLTTYNPDSAFVPLAAWSGAPCGDCGRRVDPEDASACAGCGADLCAACGGACAACAESRCEGCLEPCAACRAGCCPGCLEATAAGREVCPACTRACTGCGTRAPADERTGAERLCPACDQNQEEEERDDDVESPGRPGAPADLA